MDDVEFGPVRGGEEAHQLGAGEVGDADDEAGGAGFFGEAEVLEVGEFGGAVHGEGEGAAIEDRGDHGDVGGDVGEVGVEVLDFFAAADAVKEECFGEIEEGVHGAFEAGAAGIPGAGEGAAEAEGVDEGGEEGGEKDEGGRADEDVGAAGFGAIGVGEMLRGGGFADGDGGDAPAEFAEGEDFALDEGVRDRGVARNDVSDVHGKNVRRNRQADDVSAVRYYRRER